MFLERSYFLVSVVYLDIRIQNPGRNDVGPTVRDTARKRIVIAATLHRSYGGFEQHFAAR